MKCKSCKKCKRRINELDRQISELDQEFATLRDRFLRFQADYDYEKKHVIGAAKKEEAVDFPAALATMLAALEALPDEDCAR